jgi:hypothetical protein
VQGGGGGMHAASREDTKALGLIRLHRIILGIVPVNQSLYKLEKQSGSESFRSTNPTQTNKALSIHDSIPQSVGKLLYIVRSPALGVVGRTEACVLCSGWEWRFPTFGAKRSAAQRSAARAAAAELVWWPLVFFFAPFPQLDHLGNASIDRICKCRLFVFSP